MDLLRSNYSKYSVFVYFLFLLFNSNNPVQGNDDISNEIQAIPKIATIEELKSARQIFCSNGNYVQQLPPWLNITAVRLGQQFLVKNYPGFLYSVGLGSLLVAVSVDARRIAISGGNTTQPEKAMRRYLINILHFSYWAQTDLIQQQEELFETLNLIHSVQAKVGHAAYERRAMYSKPLIPEPPRGENPYSLDLKLWDAFERDLMESKLPPVALAKKVFPPLISTKEKAGTDYYFNQFAMAMQLWAFTAMPVLRPNSVLIYHWTDEELLGFMQFWAFIGYSMGIDDKHNICLHSNVTEARIYFQDMLDNHFTPNLFHLDYETKVVLEVGVKGISSIFPFVDLGVALTRLANDILQIPTPNLNRLMKVQAKMYNSILVNSSPMLSNNLYQTIVRFISNGLIQVPTLRFFGFNILNSHNFTQGIIKLDEQVLNDPNVYFTEDDRYKYCI